MNSYFHVFRFCFIFVAWSVLISLPTAASSEKSSPPPPTTNPDTTVADTSPERIERLIRQLGDERYELREQAQAELAKLNFLAFEALQKATRDEDLEIASRARYLLRRISVHLTRPGDPEEVTKLLSEFNLLDQAEQVARLRKLAKLREGRGIPALCRIVRFEPSIVLAKQAAIAIIENYPNKKVSLDRLAPLLRDHLGESRRLPSLWMLSYAKFHDKPAEARREWSKWFKQEQELLEKEDQTTNLGIVSDLVTQQIAWLDRDHAEPQKMVDAIHSLFAVHSRPEKNIKPLIAWLVEQKAWKPLELSPTVFAQRLVSNPRALVYGLAKSLADAGQKTLAEEAAEKAFSIEGNSPKDDSRIHFYIAVHLQNEGRISWAEREYRYLIDHGETNQNYVIYAYESLANMLHDQAENLRAAQVMEQLSKAVKKSGRKVIPTLMKPTGSSLENYINSRINYYYACHYRDQGDEDKERLAVEAGIAVDPTNPDLLIAAFNLKKTDPVFHKKIRDMIKAVGLKYRMAIVAGSDRATACNDLAWLIANTEGDFAEAVRLSRESLQEQPDNGAFHDTLARCYYAQGNLEKAVEHQNRAVELEPHSGLIIRQGELFRKDYEKKLGKPAPKPEKAKKKTGENELNTDPVEQSFDAFPLEIDEF